MSDYQRNNSYRLPPNLYREVKYLIKDQDRLESELAHLEQEGEDRDFRKLCTVCHKLSAIHTALEMIPEAYRKGVLDNLKYERTKSGYYPPNADFRTYQTYKQRLVYHTAKELNYV